MASKDNKYKAEKLLEEADKGEAKFSNVPLGTEVTASVKFGSNPSKSQTQTLTRDSHMFQAFDVKDWQGVPTGAAPAAVAASSGVSPSASGSTEAPPPVYRPEGSYSDRAPRSADSGGGGLGGIISTVVSLAFLAACAYGLYWAYNTGRLKTMLDKLGIQINPVPATEPAPNPFTKERTPIVPITEGTADPLGGGGFGGGVAVAHTPVSAGPRLVGTMGVYSGQIFPITGASVDIGRDAANAIPLPQDNNASRKHATIQITGGQCVVMDNGSSNGTFVNGVRIANQMPQPLRPGDELTVGNTRFRFEA
jgi:hypothetical protein